MYFEERNDGALMRKGGRWLGQGSGRLCLLYARYLCSRARDDRYLVYLTMSTMRELARVVKVTMQLELTLGLRKAIKILSLPNTDGNGSLIILLVLTETGTDSFPPGIEGSGLLQTIISNNVLY